MRLGLCSELSRLWIRLVVKTVLPERLSPVTASQTVEPLASSVRLMAFNSRSDVSTTMGGNQRIFTMAIDLRARAVRPQVGAEDRLRKWTRSWTQRWTRIWPPS